MATKYSFSCSLEPITGLPCTLSSVQFLVLERGRILARMEAPTRKTTAVGAAAATGDHEGANGLLIADLFRPLHFSTSIEPRPARDYASLWFSKQVCTIVVQRKWACFTQLLGLRPNYVNVKFTLQSNPQKPYAHR